ncbi:MAG: hypothetical protein COB16_09645 [Rhodobacteraceae bacterium]|nr:MAG: hypothetical protein COB16_09645 [Paracoccaceae bacterium]
MPGTYRSSLYPAFVNIVDNAIFWLQQSRSEISRIELRKDGDDFLICNNGPSISPRDRENIFSLNFSRKPGGQGMGLYISKEAISKMGLELSLDENSQKYGVTFRISPKNASLNEE